MGLISTKIVLPEKLDFSNITDRTILYSYRISTDRITQLKPSEDFVKHIARSLFITKYDSIINSLEHNSYGSIVVKIESFSECIPFHLRPEAQYNCFRHTTEYFGKQTEFFYVISRNEFEDESELFTIAERISQYV